MRILIVGGTGYIGPHVVGRLVALGHEVAVYHRGKTGADLPAGVVRFLGDRAEIEGRRPEIERLAPEVVLDMRPITGLQVEALVRTVRGVARRLVVLSSGDVYRAYGIFLRTEPGPPEPTPIAEDAALRTALFPYRGPTPRPEGDPSRWVDDYDKIPVERSAMADPALPGTVLRLPMVYGPGDDLHRLHLYLKRMDDGRPAILVDEAQAGWRCTRGYVGDVARAIAAATVDPRASGRVYNVGEADALSEAEWVRAIGRACGWSGRVIPVPRGLMPGPMMDPDYSQDLVTDTSRIRDELGFRESSPRDEAIAAGVAWERANPPAMIDAGAFDYEAEDVALAAVDRGESGRPG